MKQYEVDLVAPAVGSPFRSSIVWFSQPLTRPFARPVALYSSEDHSLLGYRIGIFDRAEDVEWSELQNVVMGKDGITPILIANLEDWDKTVREHLGEYMPDPFRQYHG